MGDKNESIPLFSWLPSKTTPLIVQKKPASIRSIVAQDAAGLCPALILLSLNNFVK